MKILLISGSRNRQGQTARAAEAILAGAVESGAEAERIFLPELSLERCRQCDENGWGTCRTQGVCAIKDDLAGLVQKISKADALVFATPVYYGDLSESIRAFLDRLRRTGTHQAGKALVAGKPAVGLCVAGGGGGGAPSACVSLERVLSICGFDMVEMIPVRRQNLEYRLAGLKLTGAWLCTRPGSK